MARILVIDDNSAVREVVKTILSRSGFDVLALASGREALSVLATDTIDLALVDIEMPDLSGYEVCIQIRANPRFQTLPIILMTGRAVEGVEEQANAAGATALVAKPFDRATLVTILSKALAPNAS